ncbi:MAG: glycine cleavage system protein GcvH [Bacteroidetes bacterium]|uniref:Glycine cleavage system H protein n=1 Tax=Candidatus Cryptobacteroides avistercoris TaxID=2840758 RepID=A0A9D9IW77_9BACT|nr:glycine cleavage system protein GcvH [Candidatus Cryptobacteroides avistercoris]
MSKIVDGLLYSESHEWVKVDGNVAIVGVSDYAQAELGDITYVDMPDVDDEVKAGDDFGAVESVKTSSEIVAPVSGKIIACNTELEDRPELINEDAYAAWIVKIEMSDSSELDSLLNASAYTKLVG